MASSSFRASRSWTWGAGGPLCPAGRGRMAAAARARAGHIDDTRYHVGRGAAAAGDTRVPALGGGTPVLQRETAGIPLEGSLRNSFPLSKQAKVILSPSKETFAVWDPQDPLEIALRQAQGDFSLDKSREVVLLRSLRICTIASWWSMCDNTSRTGFLSIGRVT